MLRWRTVQFDMKTAPFTLIVAVAASVVLVACSPENKKASVLEKANKYYVAAEYEMAVIEYQNVLQQDPANIAAIERLASIWEDRGSPMRSLAFLLRLKKAAPDKLDHRVRLGRLLLALGKVTEAREEALAVLDSSAGHAEAILLLTETVRSRDHIQRAEDELKRSDDSDGVPLRIALANLMLIRGEAESARTTLLRNVAMNPESTAAHLAMGDFYAMQSDQAKATAMFKRAAELATTRSSNRLRYADYLAQTGAMEEARNLLRETTRQVPDYMPAWRSLALIALTETDYQLALTLLDSVFKVDPVDYEGQLLRVRAWLGSGQIPKGIADLERISNEYPTIAAVHRDLATAHLRNNDSESAIVALQKAISQNPDDTDSILQWAHLNLRAGRAQPVAQAMIQLLAQRPNFVPSYPLLIEATRSLGQLDDVLRGVSQSLGTYPKNAYLHYLRGLILKEQKQAAEAMRSFETASELAPDLRLAATEAIELDLEAGRPAEAMKRIQAFVMAAPTLPAARYLEARAYAMQGQWHEAEASLLKTLEMNGTHAMVYNLLTQCLSAMNDANERASRLENLTRLRPDDQYAALVVGQVYAGSNQFPEARLTLQGFLSKRPDSPWVLNNLANLLSEQFDEADAALEYATQARKLEPNAPMIADTLGWILHKKKDFKAALLLLQESATKLPQDPVIQYHLGMTSLALNEKDSALAALRAATGSPKSFSEREEAVRQLAVLESTPSKL